MRDPANLTHSPENPLPATKNLSTPQRLTHRRHPGL
ncbi:hypothetical protein PSE_0357 [Pseudovibrio sp. FO-BEG1]|nr:hypothetical protein PSE_0357 [Pseudovibrio sp. FO-BEG1]